MLWPVWPGDILVIDWSDARRSPIFVVSASESFLHHGHELQNCTIINHKVVQEFTLRENHLHIWTLARAE